MRVRAGGSGRVQAPPTLYAHKTYGRSFSGVLATGSMPRLLTVLKLPIYCPGVCVCVCLCVCVCVYLHMSPFSRVHPCTPDCRKHVNNQQAFRTALTGLVRHVFALRFRIIPEEGVCLLIIEALDAAAGDSCAGNITLITERSSTAMSHERTV